MEAIFVIISWLIIGLVCAHRVYLHERSKGEEYHELGAVGYLLFIFLVLGGGITFLALAVYYLAGGEK